MKALALYIYPLTKGTEYTAADLVNQNKVIELFNYCQILEAIIYKDGWDFLIQHYGYEKLYKINKESDWLDCNSLEEFIQFVDYEKSIATNN